jgi:hypothetical protein
MTGADQLRKNMTGLKCVFLHGIRHSECLSLAFSNYESNSYVCCTSEHSFKEI